MKSVKKCGLQKEAHDSQKRLRLAASYFTFKYCTTLRHTFFDWSYRQNSILYSQDINTVPSFSICCPLGSTNTSVSAMLVLSSSSDKALVEEI